VRDQLFFLAALRRRDLDPAAGFHRQRVRQEIAFLDLVRQQDQFRRRLVVIELREERGQHFFRRE
jgi:hypothetical protein